MTYLYIELFLTGLVLGWGPCLICSHVVYPYFAVTKKTFKKGVTGALFFSLGRLSSYTLLGGIAGFSGLLINKMFIETSFTYYVKIYGGLFLLFMGAIIILDGFKGYKVCNFIHNWDHLNVFVLGVVTGLVPCIPLLTVLSYIVLNLKGGFIGGLGGAIFGLGTMISPFIFLIGFSSKLVNFIIDNINVDVDLYKSLQRIFGIVIVFLAIKTILIGLIMLYPYVFFI